MVEKTSTWVGNVSQEEKSQRRVQKNVSCSIINMFVFLK